MDIVFYNYNFIIKYLNYENLYQWVYTIIYMYIFI